MESVELDHFQDVPVEIFKNLMKRETFTKIVLLYLHPFQYKLYFN